MLVLGKRDGTMVLVNSAGQLAVPTSSGRYWADIKDMGESSEGVMKLRPVTFRYKRDPGDKLPGCEWIGCLN